MWDPSCSMRTERRTVKHDEANGHFSHFYERAQKLKYCGHNTTKPITIVEQFEARTAF
jgi:hypothetical protein